MSRLYGDKENEKQPGDRYDQIPCWIVLSDIFKTLDGPECKLLLYLTRLIDRRTHKANRKLGPQDLAEACGYNRNRMSQAVKALTLAGIIATRQDGKRWRIQMLYRNPDQVRNLKDLEVEPSGDTAGERQQSNSSPLSVEVKKLSPPSKDCDESLRCRQESERNRNKSEVAFSEVEPAWVTEQETTPLDEGYCPE